LLEESAELARGFRRELSDVALRDEEARVRLGHDTEAFERTLVALAVRHAPVDAVLSGAAGGDGARELGLLALLGAHEAHGGGALLGAIILAIFVDEIFELLATQILGLQSNHK